jgi:ketosteroid isomerase-like protein
MSQAALGRNKRDNLRMTSSNVELVRRGYEAVVAGDFDAISELLDPDVKWHGGDPDSPGACRNRGQALAFMRNALGTATTRELVDVVDAGDRVVVIMRVHRDDGGPELVANLTTLRDGKAVEMVHYADPADALAAAGVERVQ